MTPLCQPTASPLHPHEPEIPPTLDGEGRCLVCGLLVETERLKRLLDQRGKDAADAEDAALALMHAVGAFLERGNPTEAADNREQLKAAYMDAQCALIRTDNA